jgi:pimeloyl-ACP methyl ester carboxylesterase
VQGEDDQYGTLRQIEIAQEECYCPVDVVLLPGVKHNPAREAPEVTLRHVSDFVSRILHGHEQAASAA